MKIAKLYLRVGNCGIPEIRNSIESQENELLEFAKANNIQIDSVIYELHSAGTFNRPEWNKLMLDLIHNGGQANMLLFTTWDRFSRNAGDAVRMITILKALGVEPIAIHQAVPSGINSL